LALLLFMIWGNAQAAPAGQVINLSGPLFAVAGDGARRVLSVGSHVEAGETLITEAKTYAQVRFIDKGVVTLRPSTQFKIESFAFDEQAPEKDTAVFGLLKGALRSVTGLVGKRGNQDAYKMNTATATIGIRGTDYIATFVPAEETAISLAPYALPLLAALDPSWTGDTMSDVPAGGLIDSAAMQPFLLAQAPAPPACLRACTSRCSAARFRCPTEPARSCSPPVSSASPAASPSRRSSCRRTRASSSHRRPRSN
jgi:hypothetical protein